MLLQGRRYSINLCAYFVYIGTFQISFWVIFFTLGIFLNNWSVLWMRPPLRSGGQDKHPYMLLQGRSQGAVSVAVASSPLGLILSMKICRIVGKCGVFHPPSGLTLTYDFDKTLESKAVGSVPTYPLTPPLPSAKQLLCVIGPPPREFSGYALVLFVLAWWSLVDINTRIKHNQWRI